MVAPVGNTLSRNQQYGFVEACTMPDLAHRILIPPQALNGMDRHGTGQTQPGNLSIDRQAIQRHLRFIGRHRTTGLR